jgi:hypothetical protein
MPDLPTRTDLLAIGRDYIRQRAARIDPSQVDVLGSDANLFCGSVSVMAAELINQLAYASARFMLDAANDEDLDRFAWDRFSLTRKAASSAMGAVTFSRAVATAGAGAVPVGTQLRSTTGITYLTTTAANFGAADLTANADVRSVHAGKSNQAVERSITTIVTPGSLWDRTLAVTNTLATAHAEDREDDEPFRTRIRDYWATVRRGTLAAIALGARSVAGVASANAVEELDPVGSPARIVRLYLADSSGHSTAAMGASVLAALGDYRAAGIKVIVTGTVPQIVDVQLHLTYLAGTDSAQLSERVRSAMLSTINALGANETLYLDSLLRVLRSFVNDGLIPAATSIVTPVGDLVPTAGKTLRTTMDRIVLV